MPYARMRRVGRRRYSGIRRRVNKFGVRKAGRLTMPSLRTRRTHFFKRLGQEIILANSTIGNQPSWTASGNGSVLAGGNLTDDFGTWQLGATLKFMLQCVTDPADFTSLFDRYKIVGVKLNFLFQSNLSGLSGGNTSPLPLLTYAFDGDDANVPADKTTVQVKQYAKQRILNGNRSFSIFIRPRLDKLVYAGAVSSAYTSERACWLDAARTDVQHYGLKMWINNWYSDPATSSYKLTIQPTYYLACKDTQ